MTRKRSADPSRADAENTHPSVRHVQRVGPAHAKGLQNLVGINGYVRQGDPCNRIRLDFDMSCGESPIRVKRQDFVLGLRTCFVSLALANCIIRVGSMYEHWLGEGAYTSKATEREAIENESQGGVSASASMGADTGMSWKAKLAAGLSLGLRKRKRRSTEMTNQQKIRVELIATSGQDRWQLGNSFRGDARRADGVLLGTYFNEERSEDGDSKPLCLVEQTTPGEPVEINIRASAPLGSLVVRSKRGEPNASAIAATHARLCREGASAAQKHSAAEDKLRSQIAGLVVAKDLRKAQLHAGAKLGEGIFLIAQQTLIINGSDETSWTSSHL